MEVAVINANNKKGVTSHLKDEFLIFFNDANIKEFFLTQDITENCIGCACCFTKGESYCKDY